MAVVVIAAVGTAVGTTMRAAGHNDSIRMRMIQ